VTAKSLIDYICPLINLFLFSGFPGPPIEVDEDRTRLLELDELEFDEPEFDEASVDRLGFDVTVNESRFVRFADSFDG